MRFTCRISEKAGHCTVDHSSQDVGPIRVTAPTRAEALQKIEDEIRYWLEMCPCTGQALREVEIELVESD